MEALFAGVPKKHIKVLSLGTATVKTPHEGDIVGRYGEHLNMDDCAFAPQRKESALGDLLLLSSAVLVVPADAATYSAWCILSPDPDLAEHQHRSSAVIRLSPFLSSVEYDADGHVIVREPPLAEGHVAALAEPPRSIKTLGPEITGPAATPGALPPYRLSKAGFEAFAAMALDTNAVDVIRAVADAWMKDKLLNEPVVDGVVGRRVFSEAAAEWHAFGER